MRRVISNPPEHARSFAMSNWMIPHLAHSLQKNICIVHIICTCGINVVKLLIAPFSDGVHKINTSFGSRKYIPTLIRSNSGRNKTWLATAACFQYLKETLVYFSSKFFSYSKSKSSKERDYAWGSFGIELIVSTGKKENEVTIPTHPKIKSYLAAIDGPVNKL